MRANRFSPARVARSLITVIFLSFLNVVAGPVLTPEISTPKAEATTAGIITDGLVLDVNASNSADMATTSGSYPALTSSGGGYYEFNGTSHHIVPTTRTSVGSLNVVSIFMWVYPKGAGQLLSQLGTTTINASYHTAIMEYTGTDQLHIGLWNGGDQTSVNLSSTIATPKNNWYLVGLVYDGTKIKGYINGVYAGETSAFTYDPPGNAYYGIGARDITNIVVPASYGNMRFGVLSVYNTALSASDALFNFNATQSRFGPTVTNPSNVTTFLNRSATFSSSACSNTTSGSATCNYGWQLSTDGGSNWSFIPEANDFTYTTPVLTTAYSGYRYRLYAWDPGTGSSSANDLYTITSAAILTVSTPPGSDTDTALSFNGSTQYAAASGSIILPAAPSAPFTLESWVYPTAEGSNAVIFSQGTGGNRFYWKRGGGNLIYYRDGAGLAAEQNCGGLPQDEWSHIALTWNGSTTFTCYVNSRVTLTSTVSNPTTTLNGTAAIGLYSASLPSPAEYFPGHIDEVKIWSSARTINEISSDMNSRAAVDTANLLAYYDFNEGTGTTLYNRVVGASSSSDFTLFGSPSWDETKILRTTSLDAYTVNTFYRTYITSTGGWKVPTGVSNVRALVVAGGGGGGGGYQGGGGGAGGFIETNSSISAGSYYSIQVGTGGLGATNPILPTNGVNSSAFGFTAIGGGRGASEFIPSSAENQYAALSGGSGGGGTWGETSTKVGAAGTTGQGNSGGSVDGGTWGSGGGGAASSGGSGSSTAGGNGGDGRLSLITGTTLAGGGGGSLRFSSTTANRGLGGSGGGGNSAYIGNATPGSTGGAESGAANTGGGGGAGFISDYSQLQGNGGAGGSGIVMVRWITAAKPIFTQPTIDTTTAGLSDTITVTNNPTAPLVRNFRWQYSSDTGTSWINLETGTGMTSNTYTTPILETTTSGIRYQYRVIVTDSDTAGLSIIDTSTAVYFVINPRITISGTYTSQKYGDTHTDTFTAVTGTGTGNKTFTFTPNRTGVTWNGATANQATVTIAPTLGPGTYLDTMTATDSKGAQTSVVISIIVTKADTITVTTLALTDTYTGSTLTFIPRFTVSGLQNSDTVTPITWNYLGTDNAGTAYESSPTRPMNAGSYTISGTYPAPLDDSYTAVNIETATLTINRATRSIAMGVPVSPIKYGDTRTATATPSAGSDDGAITYSTSTSDSCTVSSEVIRAIRSSGTCSLTTSIARGNNFESAISSVVTALLTRADTLTVRLSNPVSLTYTGNDAATLPTVTLLGLAQIDTGTVTRLYSAPASSAGGPESYTALFESPITPVDVESYTVSAAFNFTSGSSSNYLNVVVETSTLEINQANQAPLRIALYNAWVGSPFTILTEGGTGLGIISETLTAGSTASDCIINSRVLTMTSTTTSYCNILVTKAGTRNYRAETAAAQINFLFLVINQPSPPPGSGPSVALTGESDVSVDIDLAPMITSLSTYIATAAITYIEINGMGFDGSDPLFELKFWRGIAGTGYTINPAKTQISVTVPAGARTGKVTVTTSKGLAVSEFALVVTP